VRDVEWTIHANVNQHGKDHSLRVTFSAYRADGTEWAPVTWRGHSDIARFDAPIDQAWAALLMCMKMLEAQGSCGRVSGIYDEPLGWNEP